MTECKKIQKMIIPFDSDKLSLKEEEMFINHIENCDDCKEEFEIHFIVTYGLSDDEDNIKIQPEYKKYLNSYDFKGLVDQKIRNSHRKTKQIRKMNEFMSLCWIGSNFCLTVIMLIYFIVRFY